MDDSAVFIPRSDIEHAFDRVTSRAATGGIQLVWLFGEGGQGKTMFLRKYLEDHQADIVDLYAQCSAPVGDESTQYLKPYQPLKDALERHLQERRQMDFIKNLSLTVLACIPIVGDLFYGIKELRRDYSEFRQGKRDVDFETFVDDYYQSLAVLSEERTVVLVIDDAQWIDVQTVDAIRRFFEMASSHDRRLVLVLAVRQNELAMSAALSTFHATMAQVPGVTEIHLPRFNAQQIHAYLESRFSAAAADERLLRWLEQKTGGNPLFVQSYIQHLIVEEVITSDGRVIGDLEMYRGMPAQIKVTASWLMKSLTDEQLSILLAASTLGYEFSLHELSHLMQRAALDLIRELRRIRTRHAVCEPVGYRLINGRESTVYRFTQHAIHTALYNELTGEEREALHRMAAQYLDELRRSSGNDPAILDSIASALHLHAMLGHQPEVAFESILLKARNTTASLDRHVLQAQLEKLAPELGYTTDDVARLYDTAIGHAPVVTHASRGAAAVLPGHDAQVLPVGVEDVATTALRLLRHGRFDEADAILGNHIAVLEREGLEVHPFLIVLQTFCVASRDVLPAREVEILHEIAHSRRRPTVAALADLVLLIDRGVGGNPRTMHAIVERLVAQSGAHQRIILHVLARILERRTSGSPPALAESARNLYRTFEANSERGSTFASYPATLDALRTRGAS